MHWIALEVFLFEFEFFAWSEEGRKGEGGEGNTHPAHGWVSGLGNGNGMAA